MDDRAERDRLIEAHLGYVRALAAQVQRSIGGRPDHAELVAYGTAGLVEAAERFDPSRGVAFTTFAYYRIRGAIFDGLRRQGWLGRTEYARFAAAANDYLGVAAERPAPQRPTLPSTEERVGELAENIDDLAVIFVTSLASLRDEDPADTEAPDSAVKLERKQVEAAVRAAVARLPEKERRLVELYYYQDLNLEQAGRELGLSKSWACRLHARAVRLIAAALKETGVL